MIINVTYKMTFAKKIDEKPAYGKQAEKKDSFLINAMAVKSSKDIRPQ